MHEHYLLLTPFLVFGILALVRFVGCDLVWGVNEVTKGSYPLVVEESSFGVARNDFSGWAGMVIQIGAEDVTVDGLGRYCLAGNALPHQVKIVDAATQLDLPGVIVTVSTATHPPNSFAVIPLDPPIKLVANSTFYVLSQEQTGGDEFFDYPTTLVLDDADHVSVTSAVFGDPTATPPIPYDTSFGGANQSYGPVQITVLRKSTQS